MATYNSFEDLPVWRSAKELAVLVYKITSQGKISRDYGLKDQVQRAAISVSSNIAEGFERGSKQELIQFLYIARGSCGELRSQFFIAKEIGYLNNKEFENLYEATKKVSKQINGFIEYLKTARILGQKFLDKGAKRRREFLKKLEEIRNRDDK
jgi:four helix bundle protein